MELFHRVVTTEAETSRQREWIRKIKAAEIKSLLPAPLTGEIDLNWKHESSMQLGGDAFDYWWVDEDHFAMYLMDVCGHGVGIGAALLCIAVVNVMRAHALPGVDFANPSQVLEALNEAFPMEKNKDMFFTLWYGVYNRHTRQLSYASGGHPPAVLVTGESPDRHEVLELKTPGLVIGGMPESTYQSKTCIVGPNNKLYLFSDGAFEIQKSDDTIGSLSEFIEVLDQPSQAGISDLDRIVHYARQINGPGPFADDFSLIEIIFK